MIRTGDEYRESIRDGREVWIDGERVVRRTTHPAFRPIVDVRARIYDLAHERATQERMSYLDAETGERCPVGSKLPLTKEDWHAKRLAVDTVLDDVGGIVTRVGDETVGEMWSLYDGQDVLNEIDPAFSEHIRHHVRHAAVADPFHVSANTDPKGDRSEGRRIRTPTCSCGSCARPTRHRRARREVRDGRGLRQPGVRQADHRRLGQRRAQRVRRRLRRRHGGARDHAHLPVGVRRAPPGRRLPALEPVRRDRHDDRVRRRRDPVGERVLQPAHPGGGVHPHHPAPLQHVPVRAAAPAASPTSWSAPRTRTRPRPASRCTRACARSWPSWPATARASTPT